MNTSEGENGNKIKNFNKTEENDRFSTFISLTSHKETTETLFYDNASAVFYLGLPKCDSPKLLKNKIYN